VCSVNFGHMLLNIAKLLLRLLEVKLFTPEQEG
jgi:hypothetical protein